MDEQKTILLSLEFDTDEGLKRAANLRSAIDADKEALKELNNTIKKNGELSQDQLVQREKLEQSIKQNTKARTDELRAIENYIKANKNANGSINSLRGQLGFLTAKWNDLSKAERDNVNVGGKLKKEIKSLSDQLKELEGSVGDNRRSVGGYLDAIKQAPGAMGKFKAGVDGIGVAIRANPLGLLLTAMQTLPKLFGASGESAGLFGETMDKLGTITNIFLDRFKLVGQALQKFFTGDFKGAAEAASKSYKGIGDELEREIKLTGELSKAKYLLERDEVRNIATSKRLLNDVERLKNIRDNEFNSIQVRNKANEDAFKVEMQRQATLEDLARRKLAIIRKEIDMRGGLKKATNEQLREHGEAEQELYDILEDSAGKQNELITNRFQLEQERLQKEKEANAERVKIFEENKKRVQEELDNLLDGLKKLEAARDKQFSGEKDAKAERDKLAEDDTKRLDKQLKDQLDRSNASVAIADKDAADKIAAKEKEHKALVDFSNAASGLAQALADESTALAEFQKAVTLFEIGLASVEAITKGIAASQAAGPFPANLIAMGTTIALVSTQLLKAKQLMDGGSAPKYKAALGGVLEGPSHSEGGIKGTGRFANVEVEGQEAIINKRSTAMFLPILSALNVAGGGRPLAPTNYGALGGLIPTGGTSGNAGQLFDYDKLASKMVGAIERMPAPVVGISDIKAKSAEKDKRMRRVTLGA